MRPSIDFLRECFMVDDLGRLRWQLRPDSHFSESKTALDFNGRWAGTIVRGSDHVGYRRVRFTHCDIKYRIFLHLIAWAVVHGYWPAEQLDHRDTNRTHSNLRNLREATPSENKFNIRVRRDSSTGLKGVSPRPNGRFVARIVDIHKRRIILGYADTPEAAHQLYRTAAVKLHGEFARFDK